MLPVHPCTYCGREVEVPIAALGRPMKCPGCGRVFVPQDEAGTGLPRDLTISRSMLVPLPNRGAATPGDMIGRLHPETLRWLGASEALAEFLGRGGEPPGQESFLDSLHEDDRVLAEDEFRQVVERGERHDFVLRLGDRDGRWRYCRIHAQARYDPGGALQHIRCNLKDVTDRVHAEQELRRRTEQLTAANEELRRTNHRLREAQAQLIQSEKQASLGTLAAGMAHEINNPLAFAKSNVTIIGRETGTLLGVLGAYREGLSLIEAVDPALAGRIAGLEEEADIEHLGRCLPALVSSTERGLARVARVVQDLREFAQLDRAAIGDLDINASLDQALAILSDRILRGRIEVDRRRAELPPVVCETANLNHALLNLLVNAIQAIEATGRGSGRLRVEARPGDDGVVIEIADDGCGIAPEVLPRIFDPFFTTKPVGAGSGLGLSLGHSTVAALGGRIDVESTLDSGSIFRVRLPVRGDVDAARPPDLTP